MDRVTQFAEKNLKNKKEFGEDARLAFARHLRDMKKSEKKDGKFPYVFIPEKADDIIELANKLTIPKGERDKSFTCEGFQEFILGSLFGWVDRETGKRRFTDSYIQMARKQGKSVLNAILGIKCSNFDNYRNGQIYCTATKQDQARIVWGDVEKFISADPDLQELFQVKDIKVRLWRSCPVLLLRHWEGIQSLLTVSSHILELWMNTMPTRTIRCTNC